MRSTVLGSILGLATVLLLVGGIGFGVVKAKGTNGNTVYDDAEIIEIAEADEDSEVVEVPEIELEEGETIALADNYDEILADEEVMAGYQEVAKELAEQIPDEYVNPNAAAGREKRKTLEDFDGDVMAYNEYLQANSGRPFDIDGYYTDVEGYETIIDPETYIIDVEGILFDNEGNVLSKEEAENINNQEE